MQARGDGQYEAEIRWTTHGVAHVRAETWGDLGFGQGWACARDQLPAIADQIVKVRSERARFHGAGPERANVASDFGYLQLGVRERARAWRAAQSDFIRELIDGYAAGYNARLTEAIETDALPQWCAAAEWLRPLDELDLWMHLVDVALLASGRNLAELIGRAEAPGPDGPAPASPIAALGTASAASNGWAMGSTVTASGHGMVLANPHFPWYGEARFWECHLTIPGELDVYGVSLLGAPGVQMGFTDGVAWAHTFSCGNRMTMYRLDLVNDEPTRYRYGDATRAMEPTTHVIEVTDDDGAVEKLERTLWSTHYGPMVNLPLLGWGLETGYTYRDANLDNHRVMEQFVGMDRAHDLDAFKRVFAEVQGLPWVNTLAADRGGRVWYTDASATPRLSESAQQRFTARVRDDFVASLLYENRVALLDGSDPDDEWLDHPDARSPGLEPFSELPQLEHHDFVVNANDSHWLSNPQAPLEGYPVLCGFERTPRSLRTRQNLRLAIALAARGGVTIDDLVAAVFDNESLSAELLVDEVVKRGRAAGRVTVEGHDADVAHAAEVLAAWDWRVDLDSVGAVLWREFIAGFPDAATRDAGALFADAFDPEDPLQTPRRLTPPPEHGEDPIVHALGHAMRVLHAAGVPIDAPLSAVQWAVRGDAKVPVHGGGEGEGMLNVLAPIGALPPASLEPSPPAPVMIPERAARTGLAQGGYQVTYGTSFLMAVELTDDGPRGVALMAYGQSGDPRSPHHHDGTIAYAVKTVRPLLFRDSDIDADPNLERRVVQSSSGIA